MEEPKLTLHEHNQFGKTGKMPESFKKRRKAYDEWLAKQPKEEEAQLDEKEVEDEKPESKKEDNPEKDSKESELTGSDKAKEAFNALENPEFPEHWYSGNYFLSDGSVVKGKQVAAKAQAQLDEKE